MHTLVLMGKEDYREHMSWLVSDTSKNHSKSCYISFNDPYHIIIQLLDEANAHHNFIVVDATTTIREVQSIDSKTYVLPIDSLFDVYLFLKNLIVDESISMLLVDSVSTLIEKHNQLPLKDMLTNLLLEVGALRCSTSLVAFKEHAGHEVIQHLNPLIARNMIL